MVARRDPFEGLHAVPEAQEWVDAQLCNWHAWLSGDGGGGGASSPMFRLYRSTQQRGAYCASSAPAADKTAAQKVERAIAAQLPMHAAVLRWYYYSGGSPFRAAKDIGIGKWHITGLLRDARARLDGYLRAAAAIESAKATSKLRCGVVPSWMVAPV
jgi:hypothetical protein